MISILLFISNVAFADTNNCTTKEDYDGCYVCTYTICDGKQTSESCEMNCKKAKEHAEQQKKK